MKIVFFGLGAVSRVMARVLFELNQKSNFNRFKFVFVARDLEASKKHFFIEDELLKKSIFVEVEDFNEVFQNPQSFKKELKGAVFFVNSSIPEFNLPIMELCLFFGANYVDLASNIYNDKTLQTLSFEQQTLHEAFEKKGIFGLINLGISPGVTNFLIGERIYNFNNMPYQTKVKKIEINLLEEIHSKQLIFSWSPNVAIEEISYRPVYFKDGQLKQIEPFSKSKTYKFPYFKNFVESYPVFQEELISLKQSFNEIENIKIFVGGNEIELMKNLYQLNLLSHKYCYGYKDSQISINSIIKEVIPKMKTPQVIERFVKEKIIKYAEFSAVTDIYLEIHYPQSKKKIKSIESIGIVFNKYLDLVNTAFSGATYISYPTGVGAAVIMFYAMVASKQKAIKGVLVSEKLPPLLGAVINDIIKRELTSYKISLINSIK